MMTSDPDQSKPERGRRRAMLIAAMVALLFLGAFYLMSNHKISEIISKEELARADQAAEMLANQVGAILEESADDLRSIVSNPYLSNPNASGEERRREMLRLVGVNDRFSELTIYDSAGSGILSTSEKEPENHEASMWFKRALEGQMIISSPQRIQSDPTGHLYMSVFYPVTDSAGKVENVLKARIPFDQVWHAFDRADFGQREIVLLDDRGNRLTAKDRSKILQKFDEQVDFSYWEQNPRGQYEYGRHNADSLYSSVVLGPERTNVGGKWAVIAIFPAEEKKMALAQEKRFVLGGISVVFLLVLAGFWTSRKR